MLIANGARLTNTAFRRTCTIMSIAHRITSHVHVHVCLGSQHRARPQEDTERTEDLVQQRSPHVHGPCERHGER